MLLQLSRPEQDLADGADGSLAVIQGDLLFTCTEKKRTETDENTCVCVQDRQEPENVYVHDSINPD